MKRTRLNGAERDSRARVLMLLENSSYPHDPRVLQEARTLVEAGYEVTVVCPRGARQRWREVIDGVRVRRFPILALSGGVSSYLVEYLSALVAMFVVSLWLLLRRGFDIVHAHNPPDLLCLIGAFYKVFGKRFVFDHHDLAPELYQARCGGQGKRSVYRALVFLEYLSCRLADHVIAANESHKSLEMRRGRIPAHRITVVRNGPDLSLWTPAPPRPRKGQDAGVTIGYGGVIGLQDGVDRLIKAIHHLVVGLGRTEVVCVIAGAGDAVPGLKRLVVDLGIEPHVRFVGWLNGRDFVECLAVADILVEPAPSNAYTDHSTMIKIMNYMALGKPIVAFDLPEHRFTAQCAALYARPNDDFAFAEALAQLMDDPAGREQMGAFGRQRVENELAWRYSAVRLLSAYRASDRSRAAIAPENAPRRTEPTPQIDYPTRTQ